MKARIRPIHQKAAYMVFSLLALLTISSPSAALEAVKNEKAQLKACERQLCRAIISKSPNGKPVACKLNKMWGKAKLKKGADSKAIRWNFGDARCAVNLQLDRKLIAGAMTARKYSLFMPEHTVNCDVETGDGIKPVQIVLAPKIKFKKGKAYKAWLKVKKVRGPGLVKGLVWTTVKLEDSIGIFHGELIKTINKFIHKQCPERYSKK